MKTMNKFGSVLGVAAVLTLGACSDMNAPGNMSNSGTGYSQSGNAGGAYSSYGVVQSIDLVRQGSSIGLGTIAGAVVGGIVGNQVGGGTGNTAATVIGAAGGAYAGHELEKRNQQPSDAYKLTIRMNDGSYQTLMQGSNADIRVGDRVRIDNGVALRY
ncbi:glycine zipper 2TM domain-containing protein [Rhodoferax sp. UBA5149]|uniref:glycine zipper 2TM domain-containing protein n=1 Tax=Rhodoferax sp. UBA5149 TaxID=1947379 RepID=UPI0025ED4A3A|nr:glycine zipper 2TM domain-containing protein [Rhodoferax sp. UBA5149]